MVMGKRWVTVGEIFGGGAGVGGHLTHPTALLEKFPKGWAVPTLQRLNSVPFIVGCVIARRDALGPDPAVRWASPQHTLQQ